MMNERFYKDCYAVFETQTKEPGVESCSNLAITKSTEVPGEYINLSNNKGDSFETN